MKRFAYVWMGLVWAVAVATYAEEAAGSLEIGDMAPAIEAVDQDGIPWKLEEYAGKYVVVYFYPAAMTGGCTKQACSYRDFVKEQADDNIVVVGISGDSPQNLKYFQTANLLNFTLLSDPQGAVAKKYGVPVREGAKSITRVVGGEDVTLERNATARRWTFVVGPDGKIIYKDDQVKAEEDRAKVIQFIRGHAQ